ncbi:hypothetical protein GCM10027280_36950 [Micromonospora polyrhachis]|uniref:Uncharacterized protein n=1 Tax=Micromonospora polyrhachis TaxID=1282883 RepID=A0A7W7WSM4_9ACTN|nr:hypothetical protein [Micromonospora polyrhachis]MBB4962285.1 hypothetical protein [Micromonospora polyrhachis]
MNAQAVGHISSNVNFVKNKGLRTFLAVAAGLAVIYFGSQPPEGGGVTNALVVLGLVAAALVWFLTKPKSDKPVS